MHMKVHLNQFAGLGVLYLYKIIGKPVEKSPSTTPAAIFYDPDSADDIDDDDPDEDLDI